MESEGKGLYLLAVDIGYTIGVALGLVIKIVTFPLWVLSDLFTPDPAAR